MKYIRLYIMFLKNNIERELQFRFNFWVHMFTVVVGYFGNVLFYYFLYGHVDQIAGWRRYEIYILLATIWIVDSIFGGVFFFNLIKVPAKVKKYELDYDLLKPVSSIFMLSLRNFDLGLFAGVFFGAALLIFSIVKISLTINIFSIIIYIVLIISGVMILYSVLFIMVTFSIKFVRINGLIQMFWTLVDLGKNSHSIYPAAIKCILISLMPFLIIYNFPTIALLDKHYIFGMNLFTTVGGAIVISVILLLGAIKFFRRTIKYYYN